MKYFFVEMLPDKDPEVCLLRDYPEGVGLDRYKFGVGEAFGKDYPKNARVVMSSKQPGTKLASFIGNTRGMLVLEKRAKEIVEEVNGGKVEYLPLQIFNHKKRLASPDYFILNPIGGVDCLDRKASTIKFLGDDIVTIKKVVADARKLKKAPDLFRIPEVRGQYVFSEKLWTAVREAEPKLTNLYFKALALSNE